MSLMHGMDTTLSQSGSVAAITLLSSHPGGVTGIAAPPKDILLLKMGTPGGLMK